VLNVALPLAGVQPILALESSAVMAALALAPAFRREGLGWLRPRHGPAAAALALMLVWFVRGLVPPAPLSSWPARGAARGVAELEPVEPVEGGGGRGHRARVG
jgi:hypothetical protein